MTNIKLPRLYAALDLDLHDPKTKKILDTVKNNPEVGLKVHIALDQALIEGSFEEYFGGIDHIWYDSKFADIPSTTHARIKAMSPIVDNFTISLEAVGLEGARYAAKARDEVKKETGKEVTITGVTVLTSTDAAAYTLQKGQDKDLAIKNLIEMAIEAKLDTVVCSPHEAGMAKYLVDAAGSDMKIITPGVKPEWAVANKTQSRVTTPAEAIENGADSLVVGTAIIQSEDPAAAAVKILEEVKGATPNSSPELSANQKSACLPMLDIFRDIGAIYHIDEEQRKTGTWVRYTSGLLSTTYINIGGIVDSNTNLLSRMGQEIAKKVVETVGDVDATVGAALGSVRLSNQVAQYLGKPSVFVEKTDGMAKAHETSLVFKRHSLKPGQKVVITEDIITKGTTVRHVVKAIEDAGAELMGIYVTIGRPDITEVDGYAVHSLFDLESFALSQEEFDAQYPNAKISEKPKNDWESLIAEMNS